MSAMDSQVTKEADVRAQEKAQALGHVMGPFYAPGVSYWRQAARVRCQRLACYEGGHAYPIDFGPALSEQCHEEQGEF
jgi:hypothetical protein